MKPVHKMTPEEYAKYLAFVDRKWKRLEKTGSRLGRHRTNFEEFSCNPEKRGVKGLA